MDGGLEVDGRNSLPIPLQRHGENYKYYNGEEEDNQPQHKFHPSETTSLDRRFYGLRAPTFFLSIALAVFVVVAVIALGVAGSRAAKRASTRSSVSCPSSNCTSSLPTYPFHINDSPFQPTSNCTSLGSKYTSLFTGASFKPQCGIDLPSNDLYSIFVYYFTDCIEACAAVAKYPGLNRTCYGVAFDTNYALTPAGQYGNCFLKNASNITPRVANINFTSSAVLLGV